MYCSDLPANPPLAPVVQLASYCSIAAGLAFDGQGLSGQLPSSLFATAASALQATDWPLGRPCRGSSNSGLQLVLSGSVAGHASTEVHEAAGLSRAQLLELFTGSTEDVARPAAAASDADQAETAAPAVDAAADPGARQSATEIAAAPAALLAAAPGLDSLRVSTDSGSEKSVDAVIRIKQPAHSIEKPHMKTISSNGTSSTNMVRTSSNASSSSSGLGSKSAAAADAAQDAVADPLAFLDNLPLYGQQDHAHLLAVEAAAFGDKHGDAAADVALVTQDDMAVPPGSPAAGGAQHSGVLEGVRLSVRAVYLLLVFAPFILLGAPMLLVSWWLLTRAAAAQQHQVTPIKAADDGNGHSSTDDITLSASTDSDESSSSGKLVAFGARLRQIVLQHPQELALQLLQQLWRLVLILFALLDLLLVLMLGGHWAVGVSAWESAGIWLRKQAWVLLHFSCSYAGAAFIKWGQWSSSRRDIFPADFCDALSTFHDR